MCVQSKQSAVTTHFVQLNTATAKAVKKLTAVIQARQGHAVAQFVEALRYKPEGRGFDSRQRQWNFPLT
jgi:hypothetical protein